MKNINQNLLFALSAGFLFAHEAGDPRDMGAQWLQLEKLIDVGEKIAAGKASVSETKQADMLAAQLPIRFTVTPTGLTSGYSPANLVTIEVEDPGTEGEYPFSFTVSK